MLPVYYGSILMMDEQRYSSGFGFPVPQETVRTLPVPRLSGSAVMGGVHLSTGNYGTASPLRLFFSGLGLTALMGTGLALTYIESWLLQRFTGLPLAGPLLGLVETSSEPWAMAAVPLLTILPLINFLILLRISPLSGYHAAEHKVVSAIEKYGVLHWDQVMRMPRAHPRCGTVLLFGIIPTLLIAYPLFFHQPVLAVAVAMLGWLARFRIGYFIQQNFTTRTPTEQQLKAGVEAGERILRLWRADPNRRVPLVKNLWIRGLPQLLGGVFVGQYIMRFVYEHLHVWLDW